MEEFTGLLLGYFQNLGYGGIIALMTVESSFIPFPSEIVIPPAGYLAAQGQFNIILVIISGIVGSLIGALINYFLAITLGRKIIYAIAASKWSNILLINVKKIHRAEQYFLDHGRSSTFFGRLVIAIRQLISIPAGLSKMSLSSFILYTTLGSGIWVTILALLGYGIGSNQQLLTSNFAMLSVLGSLTFVGFIIYLIISFKKKKIRRKNNDKKNNQES